MYWQLYDEIKRLVLEGVIASGTSMPSPRLVALEYGCSRHTVTTSYDFLIAEGILSARHGVGTFVSELPGIPAQALTHRPALAAQTLKVSRFAQTLSRSGIDRNEEDPLQIFGFPDAELFPWAAWAKTYSRIWAHPSRDALQNTSAQGDESLRTAICKFAHRTRGIRATADQVFVTSGTTQSLDLLLRALLDPGDSVWLEDPGRPKAAALVRALGMTCVHVPVDDDGLKVQQALSLGPSARAALVTASHHYPTGATLSLERRMHLLNWANETGGWIFEDDYDGEMIADGKPLLPIYSLGAPDRVVYMGTFSKAISPQLRLGYLICHPDLVRLLIKVRYYVDYFPPVAIQPVLADFIESGQLDAHIRRMRRVYRDRQVLFSTEMATHGADVFALSHTAPTLFHPLRMLHLNRPEIDRSVAERARVLGMPAFALSPFYFQDAPKAGVIVGTGRMDTATIAASVKQLVLEARKFMLLR